MMTLPLLSVLLTFASLSGPRAELALGEEAAGQRFAAASVAGGAERSEPAWPVPPAPPAPGVRQGEQAAPPVFEGERAGSAPPPASVTIATQTAAQVGLLAAGIALVVALLIKLMAWLMQRTRARAA